MSDDPRKKFAAARLATSERDRLLAIEQAARAFLDAVGETSDDIPAGPMREALLGLRVALATK